MKTFKQTVILWKLAIIKLFMYSLTVAIATYLGAMHGQRWSALEGEDRFDLCAGILAAVIGVYMAFIDQSMKSIASGNDLPPGVESVTTSSNVTKDQAVETTSVKLTPTNPNETNNPQS